jgi:hypothetical protein
VFVHLSQFFYSPKTILLMSLLGGRGGKLRSRAELILVRIAPYIYIYICVCVCVCSCISTFHELCHIFLKTARHTKIWRD